MLNAWIVVQLTCYSIFSEKLAGTVPEQLMQSNLESEGIMAAPDHEFLIAFTDELHVL